MATTSDPPVVETQESMKPVHTILLDTSPILLNTPPISTLLANSHALITTPSVLAEIRGEEARNRLQNLYMPFITVRTPRLESIKFVRDFARRTGDLAVLSPTDLEVLALAYDLECERNGGDWRLRNTPGQKRVNGSPPQKQIPEQVLQTTDESNSQHPVEVEQVTNGLNEVVLSEPEITDKQTPAEESEIQRTDAPPIEVPVLEAHADEGLVEPEVVEEEALSDSDEGWITPSNIKRHLAKDQTESNTTRAEGKVLQVATMTGDFAMQNVLLQINLNLLSTKTCKRVAHIKQMIFRCHACFATTKDMSKQFCARCGKPTLTRVTCTTNDKGEVKLHLKANYQWNNKGNVFSVPKPVAGSANQKWKGTKQGGGKGGWGSDLILAEDQKEYVRAMTSSKKTKSKDLMDEDTLPSILTGDRDRGGGRVRVGAGRNINSKKR